MSRNDKFYKSFSLFFCYRQENLYGSEMAIFLFAYSLCVFRVVENLHQLLEINVQQHCHVVGSSSYYTYKIDEGTNPIILTHSRAANKKPASGLRNRAPYTMKWRQIAHTSSDIYVHNLRSLNKALTIFYPISRRPSYTV